jgi:hypothetical protein
VPIGARRARPTCVTDRSHHGTEPGVYNVNALGKD